MTLERSILESIRNRHSAVIGMTRSGKTTFVARVLDRLGSMATHTLFIDPKHDDAFAKLGKVCYTPMQVYEQLLLKNKNIVYRPPGDSAKRIEGLDRVIELVFSLQKTAGFKRIRRVIAIDELQLFVKKGGSKAIEMIWTIGAGMGITGVAMTQRIQLLNETCWSQSDNKFIFRIEDRKDYLKSRNLEHYINQQEFFNDEMNRYWFYYTTGGGKWKKHKPVPINKPKSMRRLSLSRW
jgi:DNA helicase HerA-like ATPase